MDRPSVVPRSDTTRGTPLRILSLDGGGVRGYSMLILLHDFMHKVYTETHDGIPPEPDHVPKPCEYFDLIVGTGTGGLIALMLGRLHMNTTDCMRVYVQMTRKVFETDKTIVGIPYRSTLFKASMLEEAIRSCVSTYDLLGGSGSSTNVGEYATIDEHSDEMPATPGSTAEHQQQSFRSTAAAAAARPHTASSDASAATASHMRRRSSDLSTHHRFSLAAFPNAGYGDPHALLEDPRKEKRCKTAVTAVLKGQTERSGTTVFLRSYPSRTQPALEPGCTIWQAGRATCATKLAFKEIRIGTSTFLDEGYGLRNVDQSPTYNPAPEALEEALLNEWPGQQVGLLLSLGTGRRPATSNSQHNQAEWWEGFAGGLGSYAEAKRKLIAKIEGCETTHREMLSIHLPKYGINADQSYLRLNVEVGVGEFGMNEWNRLAEISNNTQSYLNDPAVKNMLNRGALQMAKIQHMRRNLASPTTSASMYDRVLSGGPAAAVPPHPAYTSQPAPAYDAVELPGVEPDQALRPLSWAKPPPSFSAATANTSHAQHPSPPHNYYSYYSPQHFSQQHHHRPFSQNSTHSSSQPQHTPRPAADVDEKYAVSEDFPEVYTSPASYIRPNAPTDEKIPLTDDEVDARDDGAVERGSRSSGYSSRGTSNTAPSTAPSVGAGGAAGTAGTRGVGVGGTGIGGAGGVGGGAGVKAPPRPPKYPFPSAQAVQGQPAPPYPVSDLAQLHLATSNTRNVSGSTVEPEDRGPPPEVNMARKPMYVQR